MSVSVIVLDPGLKTGVLPGPDLLRAIPGVLWRGEARAGVLEMTFFCKSSKLPSLERR